MSSNTPLLHVARTSKCNTQLTPQNVQQPMQQPCSKPGSLKALAEGILSKNGPLKAIAESKNGRNSACNSDATTLLHTPSPESAELQQLQQVQQEPEDEDYTLAHLQEMDRLLHEIARLEGWSDAKLAAGLDQRRRMAPINVAAALRLLRARAQAARDAKPDRPARRLPVFLCVIQGGKT